MDDDQPRYVKRPMLEDEVGDIIFTIALGVLVLVALAW